MSDNNPFDRPPTHQSAPPPVSGDWGPTTPFNPIGPRQSGPGRGKMAAVALGAVVLTGGAIFGISKFAGADDPQLAEASGPAATTPAFGAGSESVGGESGDATPVVSISDMFSSISECIDIEELVGSMGSLPSMDLTTMAESVGDTVLITSSDGVTVYTLGEGDASIAISKSGGQVTVAASGDVTESTSLDFADLETHLNDMMGELDNMNLDEMVLDDMPVLSLPPDFDPAEIQACIENLNLGGGG